MITERFNRNSKFKKVANYDLVDKKMPIMKTKRKEIIKTSAMG